MNRRRFIRTCFGGFAAIGGLGVGAIAAMKEPTISRVVWRNPKFRRVEPVEIDPNVIEFYELHLDEILPMPIKPSPTMEELHKLHEVHAKRWVEMYRLYNGLPPYSYPMTMR